MNDQAGTLGAGSVVAPAAENRGGPVPVAVALLDRVWAGVPHLAGAAGASVARRAALSDLEKDPRYLIGRFQQALTALLDADLPPMDAMTCLVSEALADAIALRQHNWHPCRNCDESFTEVPQCRRCTADFDQADRYHALTRALGAIHEPSMPRPRRAGPRVISLSWPGPEPSCHPTYRSARRISLVLRHERKEAKGDSPDVIPHTGGLAEGPREKPAVEWRSHSRWRSRRPTLSAARRSCGPAPAAMSSR